MPKPKVVNIKHPPKVNKPRVVKEEDFSLLVDKPTAEMREEQYNDMKPRLPKPGQRLEAELPGYELSEGELRTRIEDDRKKRRGGLLSRLGL